ncbi:MAG: YgfZ/GcvT domain-containing protein [Coraliomargarita sp.]
MRQLRSMDGVFAYQYTPAARLRVSDEDSADFLQSQFSNDLRPFEAGQAVYGLWLDVKGKVVADSWVLCEGEEAFTVISERCSAETIAEKLERHIIADDVEIETLDSGSAIALVGGNASKALEVLNLTVPDVGRFTAVEDGVCFVGRRSTSPSYELIFSDSSDAQVVVERLQEHGVEFVSEEWIQRQRMDAGVPLVPIEVGPADLPGEGGFVEDAVSLNKGCYLGQEVVARMHNVGQARRGLYLINGAGDRPVVPASLLTADGKNGGELRSVVSAEGGWCGVAMLKIRSAGDTLTLESGGPIEVVRPLRNQ